MVTTKNSNNYIFRLFFIFLIIISPFWSIVTFILLSFTKNNKERDTLQFFLILSLSYFLALIFYTANLGGDLMIYKELFLRSTNISFIDFIKDQRKEIIYSVYSFLFNKLTNGAFKFYVGFTVFIMYFILFKSIINFSKKKLLDSSKINILIIFIAFFPPLFHLSGIVFRQNLALFILFFGFSIFKKKSLKLILISVLASLIHYVAFPIFLLSLIDTSMFKRKNVIKIIFSTYLIYNYGFIFLEFLSSFSESFKYLFLRIVRDDIYNAVDSGSVEKMLIPVLLFLFQLIISIITYLKNKSFFSFLYIKYSLVFIFIYIFIDYNVLEYRLLLINYFFIPFVMIEFLMTFSDKIRNKIFSGLVILLPVYIALFLLYISIRNEPNLYKDTLVLITNPFF
jgi:hypothetical protein